MADLPNILWLMTDEQRTDSMGCYGSPWARTPHMDRMAKEGVIFLEAATPAPVCVPARVSLLTGQYASTTGIYHNRQTLDQDPGFLTHVFAEHGYQTATFGKQHYRCAKKAFALEFDHVLSDAVGYYAYHKGRNPEAYGVIAYPHTRVPWIFCGTFPEAPEHMPEAVVVNETIRWLERQRMDQLFFVRVSFNGPHTPVVTPPPFDRCIDPAKIYLPEAFVPMDQGKPAWESVFLREIQGAHRLTTEQLQRCQQCYYGQVSFLDAQFGRLLDWMKPQGLLENTIIVYVSDHGTHLGDQGMMQKQTFYASVVNVPFFFWYPRKIQGGRRIETPVETLSLMPTLLELAGLPIPEPVEGVPLTETLTGGKKPPACPVFSELDLGTWGYRTGERLIMIRENEWKLSLYRDPLDKGRFTETSDGALYHLRDDPGERKNLFYSADHQDIVAELVARIDAWDEGRRRAHTDGDRPLGGRKSDKERSE